MRTSQSQIVYLNTVDRNKRLSVFAGDATFYRLGCHRAARWRDSVTEAGLQTMKNAASSASFGFKQPDPGYFESRRLRRDGLRRLGLFPDLLLDLAQLLILP